MSVSLPPLSSNKRKTRRRQRENTVNNDQTASTSEDELNTKQFHQIIHLAATRRACGARINSQQRIYHSVTIKYQLIMDEQPHRKVFPNHQWLLAKPNRMFGLGSFGTWMCRKSRCVIKAIYYLEQKTPRCQSLCLLSLLTKRK